MLCVFSALPYVRQYDRPKNIIEGDPLQTECYAWGYPQVMVVWRRDTIIPVVPEENRIMFKNGSVENSTLRIEDMHYDNSADYTCIVTNALGSVNATISVFVKGTEFAVFLTLLLLLMLMQLWRPEFELDGKNSGSWFHCLPIRIYH